MWCLGMDDRRVLLLSILYRFVCCLLSLTTVLMRRDLSKDVELLVLRHENTVLRRQVTRVRYTPADRAWLAAWRQFLTAQAKAVLAVDFLHVDTVFLRRIYALIAVEHGSRRTHLIGVRTHPTGHGPRKPLAI
jgi:hypothetical protein